MKDVGPLGPGRLQGEAGLVGGQVCCPRASPEEKGQDGPAGGLAGPQGPQAECGGDT